MFSIVEKIKQKLQESSLSRIQDASERYSVGAISGYRGTRTRSENQAWNRKIMIDLKRRGFGVTSVQGGFIENYGTPDAQEVDESSFFVANIDVEGDDGGELEAALIYWGRASDQDSIMSKPYGEQAKLIGTTKRPEADPSYNREQIVGTFTGGKVGKFLSRIRGRPFVFD
jgi:hypothetical protein